MGIKDITHTAVGLRLSTTFFLKTLAREAVGGPLEKDAECLAEDPHQSLVFREKLRTSPGGKRTESMTILSIKREKELGVCRDQLGRAAELRRKERVSRWEDM